MLYNVTKPGFSFSCLFCTATFSLLVHFCFCCVRFSFLLYHAKWLAGKNVSETTYFCVSLDAKSQLSLYEQNVTSSQYTLALARFMAHRRSTRLDGRAAPVTPCSVTTSCCSTSRRTVSGRRNRTADRLIMTATTLSANDNTDAISPAGI